MKEMVYNPEIKNVVLLDNGIYEGFEYFIMNCNGAYPLAYIKLPDELKVVFENLFEIDLVSPHWGLTYGCKDAVPPMLEGLASKGNYLGWDYDHCDDYSGYYDEGSIRNYVTRKWTTKEILEQVKNTIREIRGERGEKNAEC